MAISVTHASQSAIPNNATAVAAGKKSSDAWNENHVVVIAAEDIEDILGYVAADAADLTTLSSTVATIGGDLTTLEGDVAALAAVVAAIVGVPTGGTTGQVLAKASNADGDAAWIDNVGDTLTSATVALSSQYLLGGL